MGPIGIFLFTKVASTEGFVVAIAILAGALLWHKNGRGAAALTIFAAGLIFLVRLLKEVFQVSRPANALIEVSGYAMPSAHAAGAAFLACVIVVLHRRYYSKFHHAVLAASVSGALLIGASRIAFQVHTIEQVVLGFVLGLIFGLLFSYSSPRHR